MTDEARRVAMGLTKAQREAVRAMSVIHGRRNGLFYVHNNANLLADLSHIHLCKMPFADRWGICDWQFAARIKPLGLAVRAILKESTDAQ